MKLNVELVFTEMGDYYVAVPVGDNKKNMVIRLNKTGMDICKYLAEGLSEEEIIQTIMEKYEVSDEKIVENSVEKVIKQLKSEKLLEG